MLTTVLLLAYGSNHTKCDRTGAPCGFDTHYPDYFPARVGCSDAIEAMQAEGMRVIPYIVNETPTTLSVYLRSSRTLFGYCTLQHPPPPHPSLTLSLSLALARWIASTVDVSGATLFYDAYVPSH